MKRILVGIGLALFLVLSLGAAAGTKAPVYPLGIEFMGTYQDQIQTVPTSGWTITIAIKALQEPMGIARRARPPQFPVMANDDPDPNFNIFTHGGFMIFTDPDYDRTGQFSLSMIPITTPPTPPCTPADLCYYYHDLVNETFLEFIPGSGLPKEEANTGHSNRLPGLVVLSDTGLGNVYLPIDPRDPNSPKDGFLQTKPRGALNLASNINSVGYIFRDAKMHLPAVTATIAGNRGLVTAKVEIDLNVAGSPLCSAASPNTHAVKYRINGGPIIRLEDGGCNDSYEAPILADIRALPTSYLRVFVVNAMNVPDTFPLSQNPVPPPQSIKDMDGDGIVTAKDAALMGYTMLSGEQKIPFKVFYENLWWIPGPDLGLKDLDGNGLRGFRIAPGGPGEIERIPE